MSLEIPSYEECGQSSIWKNMELNIWFLSGILFYKLLNFYTKWNPFIGHTNYVTYIVTECHNSNKNLQISLINNYYLHIFHDVALC